ncbi:unnamed protein product [Rangifer tarandus platyrhynchus]|uniref:Uncharacterized protein n=2 Tax=Rangifer tarandus platyrhynchus TaxID=3082113 RepID=A0AC59ZF03_RANTA|nr:unnamed protein product [Rangifer tarandus platyrhynchus]
MRSYQDEEGAGQNTGLGPCGKVALWRSMIALPHRTLRASVPGKAHCYAKLQEKAPCLAANQEKKSEMHILFLALLKKVSAMCLMEKTSLQLVSQWDYITCCIYLDFWQNVSSLSSCSIKYI